MLYVPGSTLILPVLSFSFLYFFFVFLMFFLLLLLSCLSFFLYLPIRQRLFHCKVMTLQLGRGSHDILPPLHLYWFDCQVQKSN